jgi:lipopolysaccharide transport system ATP-binding protein
MDPDSRWRTPLAPGVYRTIAWVPGNLLNEGATIVSVSLGTHSPGGKMIRQAQAQEVVAFEVVDPGEGGTARGDYAGIWSAPVRPLLRWDLDREQAPATLPSSSDRSSSLTSGRSRATG